MQTWQGVLVWFFSAVIVGCMQSPAPVGMRSDATLIPSAGLVVMTVDGRPLTSRLVQMQRPGTPVFVEPGQHEIEIAHCDPSAVSVQGPPKLGDLAAGLVLKGGRGCHGSGRRRATTIPAVCVSCDASCTST